MNLYGFVGNDGANSIDPLGLEEWKIVANGEPVSRDVSNKGSAGQLISVMAAITTGKPDWEPTNAGISARDSGIQNPTNLIQKGGLYDEVYIILVTKSGRKWDSPINAPGALIFEQPKRDIKQSPHLVQKFKVAIDKESGILSISPDGQNGTNAPSEGTIVGDGGALGAKVVIDYSHGSLATFPGRIFVKLRSSGGWTDNGIVRLAGTGISNLNTMPAGASMTISFPEGLNINDDQRNKDGTLPAVEVSVTNRCITP